ncbi:MAG: hydantoinase B/oxoprolinase family protein [Magnetococcales bacterium]|nr:hydantoinase B/oxoprolinase family protein [Magnetococcales bacterium]
MTQYTWQAMAPDPYNRWRFAVDRGGTFTDIVAIDPVGKVHGAKLLSKSSIYDDAAIEGIRRFLGTRVGEKLPQNRVAWIRLGTTVATNALLERKGADVGLLVTQGFLDILEIGSARRPDLFALGISRPQLLYKSVEEADERMLATGLQLKPLNIAKTKKALQALKDSGVTSLAILFLHAWKNPQHEIEAAKVAQEIGFKHISLSHKTISIIQIIGRGRTTLIDAYLTPVLQHYIDQVKRWTGDIPLHFMSSAGGLLVPQGFTGKDAILSGPAGGVTGVGAIANQSGDKQVIGFDMGGTSTDVCRYAGEFEKVLEAETASIRYHAPMLNVETVAAGGGSILHFDGQKLSVGPDSAGSQPGPACYGLGGPVTITDANLVVGRVVADFFPKLFGPNRDGPLDIQAARAGFSALVKEVNNKTDQNYTIESLALGYIRIANETMGRPIKNLSVAKGYDLRDHALICFGGAGGQHGCGIAGALNIKKIRLHPLAGVLSAYGIAMAVHGRTHVETILSLLDFANLKQVKLRCDEVIEKLVLQLKTELSNSTEIIFSNKITLDLRLPGTDSPLSVAYNPDLKYIEKEFLKQHQQYYGFTPHVTSLELLNLRIEVIEKNKNNSTTNAEKSYQSTNKNLPEKQVKVWFYEENATVTPLYLRKNIIPKIPIAGPALIAEPHSITVVEPGFIAEISPDGLLNLSMEKLNKESVKKQLDPTLLELFNHRFSGIAARMGETLVRTAHSVNIKERLDFSCALFDEKGQLVANAPHVPVHLGAMGATVCALLNDRSINIKPGQVYVSNDPSKGGSHLPDITVITPIFRTGILRFFVASRGHHADIGGISPGSMPPFAKTLMEEGVVLSNELLVNKGQFCQEQIVKALSKPPYPARNIPERLSDLHSMVAAGERGMQELSAMCDTYGDDIVINYMGYMRANATHAMEKVLAQFLAGKPSWQGSFEDHLDGGEKIAVYIKIYRTKSGAPHADIDFRGTSPPNKGNLNAPTAICQAAVLYVFRTLISQNIPLNDGCLQPITIKIPQNCLLNPPANSAVAGGNVETSQRVVDVLYGALGIAAASQGTMNNFLFGNIDGSGSQYYETIAGGSGAIKGHNGAGGVQVHMTNTRMTDPEVLEHRFPQIMLERFSLRKGSGGKGKWQGGDGVVRTFYFNTPLSVTILSQRRKLQPYGCQGGEPGKSGENLLFQNGENNPQLLGGSFQKNVKAGDRLEIKTPGGGGFGVQEINR